MNGKPVLFRENSRTVLTFNSREFQRKHLCDGITLNPGDACAYGCTYCYVPTLMRKVDHHTIDSYNRQNGLTGIGKKDFSGVVIRRRNALQLLCNQLLRGDGSSRYNEPNDQRVVYSSTLVDVAANLDLLRETAEACNLILRNTAWQIRLLSKSAFLHLLFKQDLIPMKFRDRMILGVSTGTLNDRVGAAIEVGTPKVSARLHSLQWLQREGYRTYGMICPSLPQEDYAAFSVQVCEAINIDRCEHVWAEVINLRGASLLHTRDALIQCGLTSEASRLVAVSGSGSSLAWEEYARATFLAHTASVAPGKLRFLQYVNETSAPWWNQRKHLGAVLLGSVAEKVASGA